MRIWAIFIILIISLTHRLSPLHFRHRVYNILINALSICQLRTAFSHPSWSQVSAHHIDVVYFNSAKTRQKPQALVSVTEFGR